MIHGDFIHAAVLGRLSGLLAKESEHGTRA